MFSSLKVEFDSQPLFAFALKLTDETEKVVTRLGSNSNISIEPTLEVMNIVLETNQ